MVLIALLGSDRGVMGRRRSGRVSVVLTWSAILVMGAGAVALTAFSVASIDFTAIVHSNPTVLVPLISSRRFWSAAIVPVPSSW